MADEPDAPEPGQEVETDRSAARGGGETREPSAPASKGGRPLALLAGLLVALVALLVFFAARGGGSGGSASDADDAGEASETGAAEPSGPQAAFVGQILLEPLPEGRRATAISAVPDAQAEGVAGGESGATEFADEGTDGESETEGAAAAAGEQGEMVGPDPQRPWLPEGELTPPGLDTCQVVAWRDGVQLAETHACDEEGRYELVLPPNDAGPTAIEILVPGRLRAVLEGEAVPGEELELGAVALGEGMEVSGAVLDARNQPVPGVTVSARPNPDLGEPEPWRAVTDREGAFLFDTLPHGPVSLRVDAPGYATTVVEAVAPERDVLIRLTGLIDLEGSVFAGPDVAAGAVARIEGSSIWPPVEVAVGESSGDPASAPFHFDGLVDGVYAVEVVVQRTDGRPEYASIPLENVTPDLKVDLALIPAYRVPVRVEDPDGEPVPGARVTLAYASVGMLQRVSTTNEEGKVRAGPVVPGPYVLRAEADGYLPAAPIEVDVDGPPDEDGDDEVLVLAKPARIEGVVLDEFGRPVPGAEVLVESDELFVAGESQARAKLMRVQLSAGTGSLGVTRGKVPDIPSEGEVVEGEEEDGPGVVTADEGGRFELTMLVPGTYVLRGTHGKHAASAPVTVTVGSGETAGGVELVLRKGVPFTGQITDTNGRAVPRATLELADGVVVTADGDGEFDAGYRRGREKVIVRAPGYAARALDLEFDDRAVDLELELEELTGRLEGRVVDDNGKPVAGAGVMVRFDSGLEPPTFVETDGRGVFVLERQPTGRVTLELEHDAFVALELGARVEDGGGDELAIVMREGWALELEVVDDAGVPLAGVHVKAGGETGVTDKQGALRLDQLGDESLELVLTAKGRVPITARVELSEDESRARLARRSVEMLSGGGVTGEVTDDRGDPVAGAQLTVLSASGRETLAVATSGRKGRFAIDGIPAGDVILRAEPPKGRTGELAPVEIETDVIRGEVTENLQLRFDTP